MSRNSTRIVIGQNVQMVWLESHGYDSSGAEMTVIPPKKICFVHFSTNMSGTSNPPDEVFVPFSFLLSGLRMATTGEEVPPNLPAVQIEHILSTRPDLAATGEEDTRLIYWTRIFGLNERAGIMIYNPSHETVPVEFFAMRCGFGLMAWPIFTEGELTFPNREAVSYSLQMPGVGLVPAMGSSRQ